MKNFLEFSDMYLERNAVYSEECFHCQSRNYFDDSLTHSLLDGDISSGNDTDGLICWNCGESFLLQHIDWIEDIDEAFLVDGRKEI
jgi:hypothetical protein